MFFTQNDTYRTAASTAFGTLLGPKNGPDNELAYVTNECGFTSKEVSRQLKKLEKRAENLMTAIKKNKSRQKIGAAAGMFENLCFYLETSDGYDDEGMYLEYVIPGMSEMMDAFEQLVK